MLSYEENKDSFMRVGLCLPATHQPLHATNHGRQTGSETVILLVTRGNKRFVYYFSALVSPPLSVGAF